MQSTLIYSEASGRLIVSKTLQETAIAMTDMRGAFHVNDILFALHSQGVTEITPQMVRGQLFYDGGFYQGHRLQKRRYAMLRHLRAGWFVWEWFEYNPFADPAKGECEFTPLRYDPMARQWSKIQ